MDISISSNFERYLFDLWRRDATKTAEKFAELASAKSFTVTPDELAAARLQFASYSIDKPRTIDAIRRVFTSCDYMLCPHTGILTRRFNQIISPILTRNQPSDSALPRTIAITRRFAAKKLSCSPLRTWENLWKPLLAA